MVNNVGYKNGFFGCFANPLNFCIVVCCGCGPCLLVMKFFLFLFLRVYIIYNRDITFQKLTTPGLIFHLVAVLDWDNTDCVEEFNKCME